MDKEQIRAELLEMVKEKAIIRGERKLASGQTSDFYIDGKQITLDPQGILLFAKYILAEMHGLNVDAIGGPTLGADPIAAAVSLLSSQTGKPVKAFLVRKQAKDHGTEKRVEGPELKEGDRVVIVEDVITTGGSVLKAIEEVEKKKVQIVKTICLVDRDQGAAEKLSRYQYAPVFELRELGLE